MDHNLPYEVIIAKMGTLTLWESYKDEGYEILHTDLCCWLALLEGTLSGASAVVVVVVVVVVAVVAPEAAPASGRGRCSGRSSS